MAANINLISTNLYYKGMSWSLQGIRRLLCVRFLVLDGKLNGWLSEKKPSAPIRIPTKKTNRIVTNLSAQ